MCRPLVELVIYTNTALSFQTLGVIHVLTGPDHLSALATLSANVASGPQAFWLGVRWGVGHSTGLLLVGSALILLSRNSKNDTVRVPDSLSAFFESLVGFFLIFLGFYGIRRAWDKRPKSYGIIPTQASGSTREPIPGIRQEIDSRSIIESYHNHSHLHLLVDAPDEEVSGCEGSSIGGDDTGILSLLVKCTRTVSTRTMAVAAGIIHGLAGPGGVLGVIPAVQLHDMRLATIYLGFFCLSSTITMGIFATIYGRCSSRLVDGDVPTGTSRREFRIECASACLSLVVGILWLVLLSIGELGNFFS